MLESDQVFLKTLILLFPDPCQLNGAGSESRIAETANEVCCADEPVAVAAGRCCVCCLQRGAEAGLDDFVHGYGVFDDVHFFIPWLVGLVDAGRIELPARLVNRSCSLRGASGNPRLQDREELGNQLPHPYAC